MSDADRAWRLRDAAVRVVGDCGLRLVVADWRGMRIVHRTPFQRPRHTPDPRTHSNALALAEIEPDLAYILEI